MIGSFEIRSYIFLLWIVGRTPLVHYAGVSTRQLEQTAFNLNYNRDEPGKADGQNCWYSSPEPRRASTSSLPLTNTPWTMPLLVVSSTTPVLNEVRTLTRAFTRTLVHAVLRMPRKSLGWISDVCWALCLLTRAVINSARRIPWLTTTMWALLWVSSHIYGHKNMVNNFSCSSC